ncbi:MAG: hypothetical protein JW944_05050 [Deltaproteobacteria bacterium]|nr:hypothetical protein [Deltaproteobacteria bacterium]
MKFSWSPDEDHNLYMLLASTRRIVFRLRNRELAKYNISPAESGVLLLVSGLEKNKATPSNLARLLMRQPHGISMLLDRMEKKRLVKKKHDLGKKNLVRIELTEKGLTKSRQAVKSNGVIKEIICLLNPQQRKSLERYLEILWRGSQEKLGTDLEAIFKDEAV